MYLQVGTVSILVVPGGEEQMIKRSFQAPPDMFSGQSQGALPLQVDRWGFLQGLPLIDNDNDSGCLLRFEKAESKHYKGVLL